jgi:hypothetical protein
VLAVVARSESTEVLFHRVGTPPGGLVPPALGDDAGTVYEPVAPHPVSTWGPVIGAWRYRPTAPDAATRFSATLGDTRWNIVG